MRIPFKLFWLSTATALNCIAASAVAQDFPTRPMRAVLPYSVGSGPDAVVRQVGEKVAKALGQQMIIDNKPGANGWLAIGEVKRAKPDGYTLVVVDNTHIALQPHLYKDLPFSPGEDFEPVSPLYSTYFFIVVAADSPLKSVSDLIAAAKEKDGNLTYGTWGIGSVAHLGSSTLGANTGTTMTHVPFKELPQLYTAVANGEVDWAFGTAATVRPLHEANKVRLLALAAPNRNAQYPDVPTVAEDGGPAGFELKTWVAMYAPKGTPEAVIRQLNEGVSKGLAEQDVRQSLSTFGFEPWAASPAALAETADTDSKHFAEVVKQTAISLD